MDNRQLFPGRVFSFDCPNAILVAVERRELCSDISAGGDIPARAYRQLIVAQELNLDHLRRKTSTENRCRRKENRKDRMSDKSRDRQTESRDKTRRVPPVVLAKTLHLLLKAQYLKFFLTFTIEVLILRSSFLSLLLE